VSSSSSPSSKGSSSSSPPPHSSFSHSSASSSLTLGLQVKGVYDSDYLSSNQASSGALILADASSGVSVSANNSNPVDVSVDPANPAQLFVAITGDDAVNRTIEWDDTQIAIIDENGVRQSSPITLAEADGNKTYRLFVTSSYWGP
jgi:hypothetical protein